MQLGYLTFVIRNQQPPFGRRRGRAWLPLMCEGLFHFLGQVELWVTRVYERERAGRDDFAGVR